MHMHSVWCRESKVSLFVATMGSTFGFNEMKHRVLSLAMAQCKNEMKHFAVISYDQMQTVFRDRNTFKQVAS